MTQTVDNPLMKFTANVPTYTVTLPVSQTKVKYRPFLVKEQKVLLLAMESVSENKTSTESTMVLDAVINLLQACTITPKKFDVRELPLLDVEYYFLQLRGKSVGEDIELVVPDYTGNEGETLPDLEHTMDIEAIQVITSKEYNEKVELSNGATIKMTQPTLNRCNDLFLRKSTGVEQTFELVAHCIESVSTEEETYFTEELPYEQVKEFVESLSQDDYMKLATYFNHLPTLLYESEATSPSTGKPVKVRLTEFTDFFG
tara:strand:- start:350 stop:1123 length:774 start_codon:yes stop_codon:yes gene_type:complete